MEKKTLSIAAFCNPLMDMITHVHESFLEKHGTRPGTMNLIEADQLENLRGDLAEYTLLPGGSGANTARGFAWLNRPGRLPPPAFFGAVGDDKTGGEYIRRLEQAGVTSGIVRKTGASGVSVIAVTPDGERTMFTHLGACRLHDEASVDFSRIARALVLHLTGYLWDTKNQRGVAERATEEARHAGVPVSLDLADPFVVTRYRDQLLALLNGRVDLLFGNREEFSLLCGTAESDEAILERAGSLAPRIVMKVGARGAYVGEGGSFRLSPGRSVKVLDTTGAGDSFAAGFLFGLLSGETPEACALLGNRLASGIVTVEGCDYGNIDRTLIGG